MYCSKFNKKRKVVRKDYYSFLFFFFTKMNRKVIKLLFTLFRIMGIQLIKEENSFLKKYYKLFFIFFVLIYVKFSILMFIYIHRKKINESLSAIPYIVITSNLFITTITFYIKRSQIKTLLLNIDKNVFTYTFEEDILVKYDWFLDEKNISLIHRYILYSQWGGITSMTFLPVILYTFGELKTDVLYPAWMPWEITDTVTFLGTYYSQILLATALNWILYTTLCFIVFTVIDFMRQNKRLCHVLCIINKSKKDQILKTNNDLDTEFNSKLKECIKHQQEIMK